MAELTIVFRLRFAVALTVALPLLVFRRVDAGRHRGARRVHRPDGLGHSPAAGQADRPQLGGRSPRRRCGDQRLRREALTRKAAESAERPRREGGLARTAPGAERHDVSGGYPCPVADATTSATKGAERLSTTSPLLNAIRCSTSRFIRAIRADTAWSRATGRGVGVAVIDTGIAGDLPDFQTARRLARDRVGGDEPVREERERPRTATARTSRA